MIGWLIFAGYVVVMVLVWRRAAYVIAWGDHSSFNGPELDSESIGFGIIAGAFVSLIWPISAPIYILIHNGDHFLKAPRHIRQAKEIEEQAARIRKLERELSIR